MVNAKFVLGFGLLTVTTLSSIAAYDFATATLVGGGLLLIFAVRERAIEDTHERTLQRDDSLRRRN